MEDKQFFGEFGESLRFGWYTMKTNFWFFFGIIIVMAILSGFMEGLINNVPRMVIVLGFINWVVSVLFRMAFTKIFLSFVDTQEADFNAVLSCVSMFFSYVAGSILYLLIIMGGPAVFIGLAAVTKQPVFAVGAVGFIIPGCIWAIKYSFYGFLIIDEELGPIEALQTSADMTEGIKWDLLGFNFVIGAVTILGVLPLGLGLFATIPTAGVAYAYAYRNILGNISGGMMTGNLVKPTGNIYNSGGMTPAGHIIDAKKPPTP